MKRRNFIKKVSATSTITFLAPSILPSGVYGRTKANNKINIGQIGCGRIARFHDMPGIMPVSYTHLRAHETPEHLVCRLLLEKKK